jgi:AraC-like DNA-binding protein
LLDRVRFALSQQLMRNDRMGLSEIAAALRYADPPSFSRAFRKWSGRA